MKTTKINKNSKLIIFSLAIAFSTISLSLKPANANKASASIPEIGWDSRLSGMGLDQEEKIGKKYGFYCQPVADDVIHAPIWGTNIYTINSGICSTAVHSGIISPKKGGKVTVKLLKGQKFYTGSKKNDVVSNDHPNTELSFTFVGEKIAQNQSKFEPESNEKKSEPSGFERVIVDSFEKGVERSLEKVLTNILN